MVGIPSTIFKMRLKKGKGVLQYLQKRNLVKAYKEAKTYFENIKLSDV